MYKYIINSVAVNCWQIINKGMTIAQLFEPNTIYLIMYKYSIKPLAECGPSLCISHIAADSDSI